MNSPTTLFLVVVLEFLMTSTIMTERMICLVSVAMGLEDRTWVKNDEDKDDGDDDADTDEDDEVARGVEVEICVISDATVPSSWFTRIPNANGLAVSKTSSNTKNPLN